jgi:pimeloyl-ACP methyl ester carboxylesterase
MHQHSIFLEGLYITYLEKNNDLEKTIFWFHGNSMSSKVWYKQFASPLFSKYRLIAFDLPAHGFSGDSAQPDTHYNVIALGRMMAYLVEKLSNGRPYVLVGLSLSTNIVAEMLACGLSPVGITLISSCIVGGDIGLDKMIKPGADFSAAYTDNPDTNLVHAYFDSLCNSQDAQDRQMMLENYFVVRAPFRSCLLQSIIKAEYSNEVALLQNKQVPVLLVFGKDEKLVNVDYLDGANLPLWKNEIFKIFGASHLINIDQPEIFNRLLADYLDCCL